MGLGAPLQPCRSSLAALRAGTGWEEPGLSLPWGRERESSPGREDWYDGIQEFQSSWFRGGEGVGVECFILLNWVISGVFPTVNVGVIFMLALG